MYVQATEMTGMSIFGKMSVGVRRMTAGLSKRMRIARTMNVYGRLRASLTIHMDVSLLGYGVQWKIRRNRACLHFLAKFSTIDGLHLDKTKTHENVLVPLWIPHPATCRTILIVRPVTHFTLVNRRCALRPLGRICLQAGHAVPHGSDHSVRWPR